MGINIENKALNTGSELSKKLIRLGLRTFHDACEYVWKLPYGRISNRENWNLVLEENKGACSSKHALLKVLADELGIEVELILGIYPMTERNTRGVGPVLDKHQLAYIPEAHCYLKYKEQRFDFTRFDSNSDEDINEFLYEEVIQPEDIGERKVAIHRDYLKRNLQNLRLDDVWQAREECIAALSELG